MGGAPEGGPSYHFYNHLSPDGFKAPGEFQRRLSAYPRLRNSPAHWGAAEIRKHAKESLKLISSEQAKAAEQSKDPDDSFVVSSVHKKCDDFTRLEFSTTAASVASNILKNIQVKLLYPHQESLTGRSEYRFKVAKGMGYRFTLKIPSNDVDKIKERLSKKMPGQIRWHLIKRIP